MWNITSIPPKPMHIPDNALDQMSTLPLHEVTLAHPSEKWYKPDCSNTSRYRQAILLSGNPHAGLYRRVLSKLPDSIRFLSIHFRPPYSAIPATKGMKKSTLRTAAYFTSFPLLIYYNEHRKHGQRFPHTHTHAEQICDTFPCNLE